MARTPEELPIQRARDEIRNAVRHANRLVVVAPTGSGKSTQLPKMLLDLEGVKGDIVVLEPRRLAARTLAMRVAHELGDECGGIVGFETRHDRKLSTRTRIRFVTDGLFVRQMQSDPALARVGRGGERGPSHAQQILMQVPGCLICAMVPRGFS